MHDENYAKLYLSMPHKIPHKLYSIGNGFGNYVSENA